MCARRPIVLLLIQTCCVFVWLAGQVDAQPAETATPDDAELFTRRQVNEKLPLERGEPICIPVKVFDETIVACVDTGASLGGLDAIYRHRLQGPSKVMNVKSSTGPLALEIYRSPSMEIGRMNPVPFQGVESVYCLDMANLREASGIELKAIIGISFLKNYVLRLNFDEGFAVIQSEVSSRNGHRVTINVDRTPFMKMEVSDTGLQEFQIDTGKTGGLMLETSLFNRLHE